MSLSGVPFTYSLQDAIHYFFLLPTGDFLTRPRLFIFCCCCSLVEIPNFRRFSSPSSFFSLWRVHSCPAPHSLPSPTGVPGATRVIGCHCQPSCAVFFGLHVHFLHLFLPFTFFFTLCKSLPNSFFRLVSFFWAVGESSSYHFINSSPPARAVVSFCSFSSLLEKLS